VDFDIVDLTGSRQMYLVRGLLLAATEPGADPDRLVASAARFTGAADPPGTEAELGALLRQILAAAP
jgi:hypothetical protein